MQLGQSQLEAGQFSEAVATFESVLDRGGDGSFVRTNLGVGLLGLKRYQAAIEQFDRAIGQPPVRPEALYNRGVALGRLGQTPDAIASYRRAIQLRPNYAQARFKLGNALALTDQFVAAAAQFRELICLRPDELKAYRQLAAVYRFQGKWAESIQVLRDGHATDARQTVIARELALAYLDAKPATLRDATRALQYATILSELTPRNAESSCLLAICLTANQRPREALAITQHWQQQGAASPELALVGLIARRQLRDDHGEDDRYNATLDTLRRQPPHRLRAIILELAGEPPPIESTAPTGATD